MKGLHFVKLLDEIATDLLVPNQRDKARHRPRVEYSAGRRCPSWYNFWQPRSSKNERLRSAALPDRTDPELEELLGESLPYPWMQSLVVGLKDYAQTETQWASHPLARAW